MILMNGIGIRERKDSELASVGILSPKNYLICCFFLRVSFRQFTKKKYYFIDF